MEKKADNKKIEKAVEFKGKYLYGLGKRKRAVARARLYAKQSGFVVNGKAAKDFFDDEMLVAAASKPLVLTGLADAFGVSVVTQGGGKSGMAIATSLAISRALLLHDEKLRIQLKPQGLLSRDSRKKERKKPGLHRARRAHQFSKR